MSKHKARQIARITNATMHLIAQNGLSRITIAGIAQEAGITRQTIYNYFDDVESIIANALSEHSQAYARMLLEAMDGVNDPFEKMRALAEMQISMARAEHENIDLDAALSAKHRAAMTAHMNPVKSALKAAIVAGAKNGVISSTVPAEAGSTLVWELTEAAMRTATSHPDQKPQILEALTKAMQAALQS